jgi:hypothetical protein
LFHNYIVRSDSPKLEACDAVSFVVRPPVDHRDPHGPHHHCPQRKETDRLRLDSFSGRLFIADDRRNDRSIVQDARMEGVAHDIERLREGTLGDRRL